MILIGLKMSSNFKVEFCNEAKMLLQLASLQHLSLKMVFFSQSGLEVKKESKRFVL